MTFLWNLLEAGRPDVRAGYRRHAGDRRGSPGRWAALPIRRSDMILDRGFPRGARNYWKSSLLAELSDAAIDALIARFAACPSPMSGLGSRGPPVPRQNPIRQPSG